MLSGVTRDVQLFVLCRTYRVLHVGFVCLSEAGKGIAAVEGLSVDRISSETRSRSSFIREVVEM
jgi:hypothetical protein